MATHSSVLAWRIPGTGEPGGLPFVGLQSWTRLMGLSSSSSTLQRVTAVPPLPSPPHSSPGKKIQAIYYNIP